MNFDKSKCKGSYLHKFLTIKAERGSVLERCVKCGQKHVIRLVNNEPNVVEYSRWHMREFLVPQHRLFGHEFQKINRTRYA